MVEHKTLLHLVVLVVLVVGVLEMDKLVVVVEQELLTKVLLVLRIQLLVGLVVLEVGVRLQQEVKGKEIIHLLVNMEEMEEQDYQFLLLVQRYLMLVVLVEVFIN